MGNAIDTIEKAGGLASAVEFIAGIISGIAGLFVGYPFDTVKVRFQTPTIAGKYHSTFHAITTIVHEEKFVGLYKGILSPLTAAALSNGLIFASYRFFLRLQLDNDTRDSVPTLTQIGLAGAFTGIVCSLVTTPTELVKIRQQEQLVPTSTTQIALKIYKEYGIPGLYRGITATILRDLGYGAYFVAYEGTCRCLLNYTSKEWAWITPFSAGAMAGIAGWVVTFPFDVVKTRMQGSTRQGYTPLHSHSPTDQTPSVSAMVSLMPRASTLDPLDPYRTVASTIVNSYRTEGIGVFFRGLAPTLIRAIPVNMVTFATFEATVLALS